MPRSWVRLTLATWNIGPGRPSDVRLLMADADLVACQEAGDRKTMLRDLATVAGWKIITGNQPGQSSTPLLYDPTVLKLEQTSRVLVAPAQYVGPGAGPDRLKAKWLIGGLFRHVPTGRRFWAYSVHYVATQGKPRRRAVALATSRRILLRVKSLRRPVIVLGDYNALPDSPVLRILLELMRLAGDAPSHGRRSIDHAVYTPRRWLKLSSERSVETHSDHRAVVLDYAVRPKR